MGPKKQKQTMSLGTFLGDQSLGSWADEMEDSPMPSQDQKGYSREPRGFQSGPRSDREDRFPPREPLPLPSAPPYTAHLGNLSFDVTAGDIEDFFAGCEVTNVRIVEDKLDRKPKGFGYVEFKTVDGLKQALTKSGTSFQNRQVRVSVADPPKDRPEQRSFDDWTRKGPLPELPQNARRTSAGPPGRSFDNFSDAGSERGSLRMERGGSRRGAPAFEGDGKSRDFSNWERKGPPTPVERAPPSREGRPSRNLDRGLDRSFERRPSPAWGEGKSQDGGSRPPRPAPERQPTAADLDNQWRARMKPDPPAAAPQQAPASQASASPTPDPSQPSSPTATSAASAPAPAPAPAVRPKLNLQKRTVSEVPQVEATSATDSKASPFGAARPIDTASKELAVAAKRDALRKQREEEDKARAEKEKTEKAEKPAEKTSQKGKDSAPSTPTAGGVQENGASSRGGRRGDRRERDRDPDRERGDREENGEKEDKKAPGRQYEILRRMTDEVGAEEEGTEGNAGGEIIDDKAVKPKEVVRPIDSNKETNQKPSAEKMEEEGWSTITSAKEKSRHRKRNSMAAQRAMAS